jgi:hypothetical protein
MFRFSESSAAYSASNKEQQQQHQQQQRRNEADSLRSPLTRKAADLTLAELSYVVSPGQQTPASSSSALLSSPFLFSVLLPLLRAFDVRCRCLLALSATKEGNNNNNNNNTVTDTSIYNSNVLSNWLDNFVQSVYLPRIRVESSRVLQEAMLLPPEVGSNVKQTNKKKKN